MDISTLRIFVDVMEQGSFAAAARDGRLVPSSVSRAIASLEEELEVRLFQRNSRHVVPTDAANIYFERVRDLVREMESARLVAKDLSTAPSGRLRVSAPVAWGRTHLVPLLPSFLDCYPELSVELLLEDASPDLIRDRIDVAVRLGAIEDSDIVATRLCTQDFTVCASPTYLARRNRPTTPDELVQHDCLLLPSQGPAARWRFRHARDGVREVTVRGRCRVSDAGAMVQCAVAGIGIGLLPVWAAKSELEQGTIVAVLSEYEASPMQFDMAAWLLFPSKSYLPLKVRAFIDYVKQKLDIRSFVLPVGEAPA